MKLFDALIKEISKLKDPTRASLAIRFFKIGKGEYGYGDQFLGIRVPDLRKLSKDYQHLELTGVLKLLKSKWHEERLLALFILILKYSKGSANDKQEIFKIYIDNYRYINNWDLVDSSAWHIVGAHLNNKNKKIMRSWLKSSNLWQRRIAVVSTFYYIRNDNFNETFLYAKQLLNDEQDLIHKAVGWMLREVGKRDIKSLDTFLCIYYKRMPRTMLRYAIERHPEKKRKEFLLGSI